MQQVKLQIDGMSCGHCVAAVKEALAAVPGVAVENVSIGQAMVSYDTDKTNTGDITDALGDIGYEASVES